MASLVISKWSKLHQGIFKIARDQGLGLLPTEDLHRNIPQPDACSSQNLETGISIRTNHSETFDITLTLT